MVLVVDDSPIDRMLVGGLLTRGTNISVRYAADGGEALELMRSEIPDLVLTDLQMPKMDGLALVEAIRQHYPLVPTILMTAHGSEETALLALERGAASYVPKRNLARRLVETVRDVLAVSGAGRQQRRLFECWNRTEFQFVLDNDVARIPPLVAHLQQYMASAAVCDATEFVRVGVALHEAIRNAMHHGNLELDSALRQTSIEDYYLEAERRRQLAPYMSRRVYFSAIETPEEGRYTIRDEGQGYDTRSSYDPTDSMNLERPSGRGLFLIRMFMDEVIVNERGSEITLIHRRRKQHA